LLEAAGARLVLVVVNNGGGGIFARLPIQKHPTAFTRLFLTPQRCDIGVLCQALGARHRATSAAELSQALVRELERPGLGVLEVPIDLGDSSTRRAAALAAATSAIA
jgi:2-succinyl-5-enolpyruvyl-6-hydroxy-3-cyclohexene-1-carboxylate synthase